MKLNLAARQTGHLMTDLGIQPDRCEELCSVIQDTILDMDNKHDGNITLAQVVQKAVEHAHSYNESIFIAITAGEYFAEFQRYHSEQFKSGSLKDMFEQVFGRATVFSGN